jgi:hypothetical protein
MECLIAASTLEQDGGALRFMMIIRRAIFTGLGCAVALAGCSPVPESPDVQKFESSELHEMGTSCTGTYFAFEDGDFVMVKNEKKTVVQKDVKLSDLGSHRLTITAPFGNVSSVSTFTLYYDDTVAKFDSIKMVPEPTPEQLDKAGLPKNYISQIDNKMRNSFPTMVLCPRSATSTLAPGTGIG